MINGIDPVDKWYLDRYGKFTASENHKLISPAKVNKFWSETADTYIEDRAIQCITDLWERPELEEVKSLLWGKVHEYPAYEAYVNATRNYSMAYLGTENPLFFEYDPLKDESGGTPDIVNWSASKSVDMGAELKCPKNPAYHFRRLNWKDQWDIKEGYILCYTQIQNLMMITGAQEWHFVSFDDRQKIKSKKIKIIPVYPDKKFQDNLDARIRLAIKEKYKLLSERLESEIKCKADLTNIR